MPEQDREIIEGQSSDTPSSNSFIEGRLGQIRGEIAGVDSNIDPVEGDVLKPKSIGIAEPGSRAEGESKISVLDPQRLSHRESALGSQIRDIREKKRLKKAS